MFLSAGRRFVQPCLRVPQAMVNLRHLATESTESILVVICGPDRQGLVWDFAKQTSSVGANIEESRMMRMGSHFSLMAKLTLDTSSTGALQKSLNSNLLGYQVVFTPMKSLQAASPAAAANQLFSFSAIGPDRPHVVRDVAELFARKGINIEDIRTRTYPAPQAGYDLFELNAIVSLPSSLLNSVQEVNTSLLKLQDSLGFDITPLKKSS
eukprot:c11135_g1_i1.p1 GENE.c11135_g1_i1~~c11135_g1_i1.p1  ORF type:complete len:225 (-),score=43.59 c11135_g1_i1:156-785(-)